MDIKMAGIDHNKAGIEIRELFSMSNAAAAAAMHRICEESGAQGCVVLSTCNRTEVWMSGGRYSPFSALCQIKGVEEKIYHPLFTERSGNEAVTHLFELSCGLKSQIFGEDQIITQVKNAIAWSRENRCADAVLENLFRMAVTAAKRVKTQIRLTGAGRSVAASTVSFLHERFGTLAGVRCMVIGNGEIGKLAASELVKEGASVLMTLRQHHHGEIEVPHGVQTIPYDQRMALLPEMQMVVSATSSPHYTLRAAEIGRLSHPVVFCDLAVPRDIEPGVAAIPGAYVFDTDRICNGDSVRADEDKIKEARAILHKYQGEFENWYHFRDLVPIVNEISGLAAEDMMSRVEKSIRRLELEDREQEQLEARINAAAEKVVGRLMFGLRSNLAPELWKSCIEGLQKSAQREVAQ